MPENGDLDSALKRISEHVEHLHDVRSQSAPFIRDLHRQWKADGGKASGKPRHSDRCLEEFLKERGTPVRSLTPKLVGKTGIQPKDASALICVFLSKWPMAGAADGEITYGSFLREEDILAIAGFAEERIANSDLPSPSVSVQESLPPPLPGEDIGSVISRFFEEADVLITVSPEHTLIVKPKTELIGFRNLINEFWKIERRDNKPRLLVWVLDYGDQIFDDLESRRKFLNVQSLISRFKALKLFDDRGSKRRWEWLVSRAAIILLDTVQPPEFATVGGHNRVSRPHFVAHNVSLTSIGQSWLSAAEFRALYGRNLDQLDQRSFSVFFSGKPNWQTPKKWAETSDLRYFGYASFGEGDDSVGRGLELPPLPHRNASGFHAVAIGAAHALKLVIPTSEALISGEEATEQLHYLGFRILRLDEFLEKY